MVDEMQRYHGYSLASAMASLKAAKPVFRKLRLLRNNVFAHRTVRKGYDAMFADAKMTPDQLRDLVGVCITVTNEMLAALDGPLLEPSPFPREQYAEMLKLLDRATPRR